MKIFFNADNAKKYLKVFQDERKKKAANLIANILLNSPKEISSQELKDKVDKNKKMQLIEKEYIFACFKNKIFEIKELQ